MNLDVLLKKQQADKNIIDILDRFCFWGIFKEQNRNDDDTMVIWAGISSNYKEILQGNVGILPSVWQLTDS